MPDLDLHSSQQVPETARNQEPAAPLSTLLLGYGNVDRQDDGVAWHILREIASHLGYELPVLPREHLMELTNQITIGFYLHLVPEHAELLSHYNRVAFIDAHTGNIASEVQFSAIQPGYEPSPFTHHLTPATCLALAEALYQHAPQAMLLSIRGFAFEFDQSLSPATAALVPLATEQILTWLG